MKRIGKIGRANIEARKRIAKIAEEKNLNYCELNLEGCLTRMYLGPAHRKKRAFYRGSVECLSDYNEWISACVHCHNRIENDKELTEAVFTTLRPHSPQGI